VRTCLLRARNCLQMVNLLLNSVTNSSQLRKSFEYSTQIYVKNTHRMD